MNRALMTAASGMKAQQMQVDTIANNIANANTNGFKKSELSFRALFYQTYREPGAATAANQRNPIGLQVGSGTEVAGSAKIFSQGELEPSSGTYSMALVGEGFFGVRMPSGEMRYTRDGNFHQDGNGNIVTNEGFMLDGAPVIPREAVSVSIGDDGRVEYMTSNSGLPQEAGRIPVWRFPNAGGLRAQGNNMFSETPSSGTAVSSEAGVNGTAIIRQGQRERSNVQVVDELVGLIVAQRSYEVNSRAIRASDEMLQQVNQMLR